MKDMTRPGIEPTSISMIALLATGNATVTPRVVAVCLELVSRYEAYLCTRFCNVLRHTRSALNCMDSIAKCICQAQTIKIWQGVLRN